MDMPVCISINVVLCTLGMQFKFQAKDGDTYHQCEQQIDSLISQASSYASGDYIVSV